PDDWRLRVGGKHRSVVGNGEIAQAVVAAVGRHGYDANQFARREVELRQGGVALQIRGVARHLRDGAHRGPEAVARLVDGEAEDAEQLVILGGVARDATIPIASPDAAMVDVPEKQIAAAGQIRDALDDTVSSGQFGEDPGLAPGL